MGLPLFIPPVESDLPSKSSTKGPSDISHTRTPIRRPDRRRQSQINEAREHRFRMLAALEASNYNSSRQFPVSVPGYLQRSSSLRSASRPPDTTQSPRHSPRPEIPRFSELNDTQQRYLAQVAAIEIPRGLAMDDLDDAWSQLTNVLPSHISTTLRSSSTQPPSALPSVPSRLTSFGHPFPDASRRSIWRRDDERNNAESRYRRRRHTERDLTSHRYTRRVGYTDGLGDRDRSLSPEGDGVWDTLQSTLTPDPQPPSVGSSFASAGSANTSETNGTNSADTSVTIPNEEVEPPCDPVTDNPGSDDEDEHGEQPDDLWPQITVRDWRRSYADVAADTQSRQSPESGDANEPDREWLSGMHRIVQSLASRVDIPDEWWAQAGLSRSMSWEDSN
ncbi:hypothetical protein GQX73_g2283 [Xylaria multiplex]|uniref:Uncharacterized protein n=1 Tax=Xylaria multiplex TaxID=323545 RepID=A0A7C8IVG6_9PEZI|nr:hypothetical protein GQX73_g2283 [Xylaria multiplex]